ncbi:MAG: DNA-protecting protein DprA, partial [Lachnospiraceae bacterium]|nr:DNA-protecting protein DprA [Lachnospiraceae bacterium]
MQQYEIQWTEILNDIYPKRLSSILRPPLRLYYRGAIGILNQNCNIAVIGSRNVSERGIEYA